MRVTDTAYVLHTRQYRETSAIVRCLSQQHGLISIVVKGVYATNKRGQQLRAQLQPANQIELEWLQKSSALKSATQIELITASALADTRAFLCMAYAGELCLKLLAENQAATVIYEAYSQLYQLLKSEELTEPALRIFEFTLLEYMGLLIDFQWDFQSQQLVCVDQYYTVIAEQGVRLSRNDDSLQCPGSVLKLLAVKDFSAAQTLIFAKQISRYLINHALGGRPLNSRQLYRDMLS